MRGQTSHNHGSRGQRRRRRAKHLGPSLGTVVVPWTAKPGDRTDAAYAKAFPQLMRAGPVYGRSPAVAPREHFVHPDSIVAAIEDHVLKKGTEVIILDPLTGLLIQAGLFPLMARSAREATEISRLFDPSDGVLIPIRALQPTIGPNQYRCSMCLEICDKKQSEEEALAELARDFPGFTQAESDIVCDDCYRMVMGE